MALLISKNVSIMGGIEISQIYVRFGYKVDFSGKIIYVNIQNFISKESYNLNLPDRGLSIESIPGDLDLNYDREVDGVDPLEFIHNQFKTYLSTDKIDEIPLKDPSTGSKQYDPSTGELITQSIIAKSKFAEESEIEIIDLDF